MSAPREMPFPTHDDLDRIAYDDEDEVVFGQLRRQARLALTLAADLERVERELVEARAECGAWETGSRIASLKLAAEAQIALTACQAQLADARDALAGVAASSDGLSVGGTTAWLNRQPNVVWEGVACSAVNVARAILARPLDRSALDAMLKEFGERERREAVEEFKNAAEQIVLRANDAEMVDDDQGPFLSPEFFAKVEVAMRRRAERKLSPPVGGGGVAAERGEGGTT